jgi:chemotaxis signal transduction protein
MSQLVVFTLSGKDYAFPIAAVSEIIRHAEPRGVASDTRDEGGKVIVLDTAGGQLGVMVDDVDQVVTVSDDQLEDIQAAVGSPGAIAKLGDRLVMVLDPASLSSRAEEAHATV